MYQSGNSIYVTVKLSRGREKTGSGCDCRVVGTTISDEDSEAATTEVEDTEAATIRSRKTESRNTGSKITGTSPGVGRMRAGT